MPTKQQTRDAVVRWYATNARPLPWRAADVTPWGVLVSEIMAQQTPVARVEGPWRQWMERWPTPRHLADADVADVLRAWGRLGYPRRALRLLEAAQVLSEADDQVPADEDALRALPGVGRYTAAAVLAFAFQRRSLVLDTNIRRVLARLAGGEAQAPASETVAERARATEWLPSDDAGSAAWNQAAMELGALVCTAKAPDCDACPVQQQCRWVADGKPAYQGTVRAAQPWARTDRQCRGRIMAALRSGGDGVAIADLAWNDPDQLIRCVASLETDGLAHREGAQLRIGPLGTRSR